VPYRTQKLRPPRVPRKLTKGKYVLLAMLGVIFTICYAAAYLGRVR
jgi:hypothetical protein